ncbi:hypothetical protein DVH05_003758 [Phytophthora capsici]|nr:hypothetical protein DVH05_003758 [Phytophthora capsici]
MAARFARDSALHAVFVHHKRLLCKTLPSDFKGIATKRMDEPVHVVWRLVEKQYSLSNAAGVVGLVGQFMKVVNSDFKSVGQEGAQSTPEFMFKTPKVYH